MNAEELTRALHGRWHGSSGTARCPAHDDRNPSLSISDGVDGQLLVHCHAGCSQDHVLTSLRARGLWTDPDNLRDGPAQVAKVAQLREHAQVAQLSQCTDADKQALDIWKSAVPAPETPVETYLRSRGYEGPIPPTLKYAPNLKHQDGSRHPAMVAAVTRVPDRKVIAIHRTFLSADGRAKADVAHPKMGLGPIGHGAVRLAAASEQLVVAEGIETALAILAATGMSTWAAISAGGIKGLILPALPMASEVLIGADNDPAGIDAAHVAAERWSQEGRCVRIALPPKGQDFADLLLAKELNNLQENAA